MKGSAFLFLILTIIQVQSNAQPWITNSYEINIARDSVYGRGINFSGATQDLTCDIAYPINDEAPECGRPLAVIVHGGSFMAGSKEDYNIQVWLSEFAKKGYVTMAINYRLGMYQTPDPINCLVEKYGCLNTADSSEWFRANYRGSQDCHGAIRYMVSKKDVYNIDPQQIFLIGESAGGFVTLQTAFLDGEEERHPSTSAMNEVVRPSTTYQTDCIPPASLSITEMSLSRPDLGHYEGDILTEFNDFKIKGVASVYGGIMQDFLKNSNSSDELPALYMFAQPNDLIVPFRRDKVMAGLSACASQSSGCPAIVNTPLVHGNKGIETLIENHKSNGEEMPEYLSDLTQNTADCLLQVLFPALSGHAMDDIWVRTKNMATFFANKIEENDCTMSSQDKKFTKSILVYPSPVIDYLNINNNGLIINDIALHDCFGNQIDKFQFPTSKLYVKDLPAGVYFLMINSNGIKFTQKFIKI